MKLEVGMHARTRLGIGKIIKIDADSNTVEVQFSKYNRLVLPNVDTNIIKASYNLINLIEVGDYVNGKLVVDKWEEPSGTFVGQIFIQLDGEQEVPVMRIIESIATKEQLESISYKVGNDNDNR